MELSILEKQMQARLEMLRACGVKRAAFLPGFVLAEVEFVDSMPPEAPTEALPVEDPEPDVPPEFVAAASAFQPRAPKGSG